MRRERYCGANQRAANIALLLWRRRPGRRGLLRRRGCNRRGGGGRCRSLGLGLRLCRRLSSCRRFLAHRFLERLGRRRRRRQFDLHRVGTQFRQAVAGGNWFDVCRLRQIAVEREGNGHRRIGRQGEGARRTAGLPIGRFGFGARRSGLETDSVHHRRGLQRIEIHPIRGGGTRRKG